MNRLIPNGCLTKTEIYSQYPILKMFYRKIQKLLKCWCFGCSLTKVYMTDIENVLDEWKMKILGYTKLSILIMTKLSIQSTTLGCRNKNYGNFSRIENARVMGDIEKENYVKEESLTGETIEKINVTKAESMERQIVPDRDSQCCTVNTKAVQYMEGVVQYNTVQYNSVQRKVVQ